MFFWQNFYVYHRPPRIFAARQQHAIFEITSAGIKTKTAHRQRQPHGFITFLYFCHVSAGLQNNCGWFRYG